MNDYLSKFLLHRYKYEYEKGFSNEYDIEIHLTTLVKKINYYYNYLDYGIIEKLLTIKNTILYRK